MMNSHNFTGNLGGDAETRFTKAGNPVVSFSVAMASGWGENKKTTWVRCVMFGKRGESVAPFLLKGQRVGITGESYLEEWQAKDGTAKASFSCKVDNVTLLGDKAGTTGTTPPGEAVKQQQTADFETFEEDIPF